MNATIPVLADLQTSSIRESSVSTMRRCPVCGTSKAFPIHAQNYAMFDDCALPTATSIVACVECGMTFATSDAGVDAYRRHYADHSKYESACATGSGTSESDAGRLSGFAAWIAARVPPRARVLDVGAGRGGLLLAMSAAGFTSTAAIDPSSACVAAMQACGIEAHVGDLEALTWPTDPQRYDLIVLSHVLEHVFDVSPVFTRLAERVAPGGLIYVEVPDASRYRVGAFPPFYFFDPEHINHFDYEALAMLGARSGWRVTERRQLDIDLGGGQLYPALGVLFATAGGEREPARATSGTGTSIAAYVEASHAACDVSIASTLRRLREDERPVVVWGAGSHAQRLLVQTALGDCAIDCMIDRDAGKQGRRLAGRLVVSPDDGIARATRIGADVIVAIAVGGNDVVDRLARELSTSRIHQL